jgi:hypothetical protein
MPHAERPDPEVTTIAIRGHPRLLYSQTLGLSPLPVVFRGDFPRRGDNDIPLVDPLSLVELLTFSPESPLSAFVPTVDTDPMPGSRGYVRRLGLQKTWGVPLTDFQVARLCGFPTKPIDSRVQIEEVQEICLSRGILSARPQAVGVDELFVLFEGLARGTRYGPGRPAVRLRQCMDHEYECVCRHLVALAGVCLDAWRIPFRYCIGVGNNVPVAWQNCRFWYFLDDTPGHGNCLHNWLEVVIDGKVVWIDPTVYCNKYNFNGKANPKSWEDGLGQYCRALAVHRTSSAERILYQWVIPGLLDAPRVEIELI